MYLLETTETLRVSDFALDVCRVSVLIATHRSVSNYAEEESRLAPEPACLMIRDLWPKLVYGFGSASPMS